MGANADDPLLAAAARICDGLPVDWRRVLELLANSELETVAQELESIEHLARVSGAPPATWGRFSIVEELGRGVFGTVYRAVDSTLQIEVALKIIRPRPGVPFNYERAIQEARRLARVQHPGVVRVYAAERIGDEVGLSMELVEGKTLDAIVRAQGPFSASEASLIGMDLCRALAAVHGAGLLHGDIKAHNVMRASGGRTMLMDFGAGRELATEPIAPGNDFAGTPIYLAPEVFAGANRTPVSDIYSLGVLLYFLVTGSYPLDGSTRSEIGRLHDQHGTRRPLRDIRPDLPEGFIRVVERALAHDPRQRFESAGALEAALAAPASPTAPSSSSPRESPQPDRVKPAKLIGIAAAILLVVGLAAVLGVIYWDSPGPATDGTAPPMATTPDPAPAAPPAGEYRIDASFYKEGKDSEEPLAPGDRVRPGDLISFQIQVSVPAYVYVINEDDEGASFLMFPLPGQSVTNPLSPGRRHRLPGARKGQPLSWRVSTAGRREHFVLFASPERSPEFETIVSKLPVPVLDEPATSAQLSPQALSVLRGVGGLAVSSVPADGDGKSLLLHQLPQFEPFVPGEQAARSIWRRRATFENPREGAGEPPKK
jgi:serine/threonine-protein kinase